MVVLLKEQGTERILVRIPCLNVEFSRFEVRVNDEVVAHCCDDTRGCEYWHSDVPGCKHAVCTIQVRPGNA